MVTTIQIRSKGDFTLPAELLNKYGLEEGEVFNVIDLGNGSFLLSPRHSRVEFSNRREVRRTRLKV